MSEGARYIDRIMRRIIRLDPPEYNRIYEVVDVLSRGGEEAAARKLVAAIDRVLKKQPRSAHALASSGEYETWRRTMTEEAMNEQGR